ncbi:hypothetical protein A3A84_02695 [Candidatus Collierbacteria bacterium RIFCSPLOWO2_01_FULL_50_23]|uniref:Uncharacterized protein n=2 Tax=Candidatus Collieribacteriota TaxID=1752725 RepID=A0A1F5EWW5_9BACT|nr:MAG: hypothetical protein A3D09_03345 [Candidatus Collierbacteria bacterium RIFCSPHIGHO2_02_FULL_49_10]OGD72215.1 MAG: hypothetical protein A2703_04120 [Candidatus Collierbacteria bacterium RIFCSPHIGHO2_01_FULL_50_25]OGD75160.1 MAG: hypothetical protein A3A84_02695 [Candidatus Collierbacteria bacterium RIFCSPLOWO2_01_FULL_50_23]
MEAKTETNVSEVDRRRCLIERILAGDTADAVPNGLDGSFSGSVLDGNTDSFVEVVQIGNFLEKLLGKSLQDVEISAILKSSDGRTKVEIFGIALGVDSNYYLSRWRNDGEKPSYVLFPKEMYDAQLIGDEETEAPFSVTEGEWE